MYILLRGIFRGEYYCFCKHFEIFPTLCRCFSSHARCELLFLGFTCGGYDPFGQRQIGFFFSMRRVFLIPGSQLIRFLVLTKMIVAARDKNVRRALSA